MEQKVFKMKAFYRGIKLNTWGIRLMALLYLLASVGSVSGELVPLPHPSFQSVEVEEAGIQLSAQVTKKGVLRIDLCSESTLVLRRARCYLLVACIGRTVLRRGMPYREGCTIDPNGHRFYHGRWWDVLSDTRGRFQGQWNRTGSLSEKELLTFQKRDWIELDLGEVLTRLRVGYLVCHVTVATSQGSVDWEIILTNTAVEEEALPPVSEHGSWVVNEEPEGRRPVTGKLREAAERGDVIAMRLLADYYKQVGNSEESEKWLHRAEEQAPL